MIGTLTNTFFSTNGEVSYKSNKYIWAYNETQIDLGVSPTVWSGFTLLMTTSESVSLIIFHCLLNGILNVLKTHGSLIQAANSLIEHDVHSGWPIVCFCRTH